MIYGPRNLFVGVLYWGACHIGDAVDRVRIPILLRKRKKALPKDTRAGFFPPRFFEDPILDNPRDPHDTRSEPLLSVMSKEEWDEIERNALEPTAKHA